MIKTMDGRSRRVVGVVRRVRHGGPLDEYRHEIYMPYRQFNPSTMFLVTRANVAPDYQWAHVPATRRWRGFPETRSPADYPDRAGTDNCFCGGR
jgi:hypothetical protein